MNYIGLNSSRTGDFSGSRPQWVGISIEPGSNLNVIQWNKVGGQSGNGIYVTWSVSNYIDGNWIGQNSSGVWFANGGFGVVLDSSAHYNFLYDTWYGNNRLGNRYIAPGVIGTAIRAS